MTSRPFLALVAALLFATAGCLGGTQPAATEDSASPTISVSAAGEVSAPPDVAIVRVAVVATADTADAARGQAATDVDRVRGALADLDLPEGAVETAYFAVGPEYDEGRELVGYRAVHALEIEAPVDAAGPVVDAAVGAGADRVDGVTFTLTDETRAELRADALDAAMASARADAETVAAAENLTITGVRSVSTSGDVGPIFARTEAAADGAETTFDPGPVTVTANVDVAYAIE